LAGANGFSTMNPLIAPPLPLKVNDGNNESGASLLTRSGVLQKLCAGALIAVVMQGGGAASAQIITPLNFSGGNSTSTVDAYAGTAGGGWLGGWQTTGGTTLNASVQSSNPLTSGGGNYLAVNATAGATATSGLVYRQFDSSLLGSSPYTISFNFRPDTALTGSEGFQIFAANAGGIGGPSSADLWELRVVANSGSGKWQVVNGTNGVVTSLTATAGTTYKFTLTITPSSGYTVSISDSVTTWNSAALAFRNSGSTGSYLYFGASSVAASSTSSFSIDSLAIVPEPANLATVSLIAAMAFGVVYRLRRRGNS